MLSGAKVQKNHYIAKIETQKYCASNIFSLVCFECQIMVCISFFLRGSGTLCFSGGTGMRCYSGIETIAIIEAIEIIETIEIIVAIGIKPLQNS